MPNNLRKTDTRGIFTNGYSYYIQAITPDGLYRWKRFADYESATEFHSATRTRKRLSDWAPAVPVPQRAGWIYFVQGVDGGLVKIGYSRMAPTGRLASLQTGSPVKLRIIGSRRGFRYDETWLHDRLAPHRRHGEWFEPVPEVLRQAALTDSEADAEERAHWVAVGENLAKIKL